MSRAVTTFEHNRGDAHQHNFENTYLDDDELQKPSRSVADATSRYTQEMINKRIGVKTLVSQKSLTNQVKTDQAVQFIRYTPKGSGTDGNPKKTRIIRMQEA